MNEPTQSILMWPAAGIGIIAALVWGYRVLPGLYLAELGISIVLYKFANEDFNLTNFAAANVFIIAGLFRSYFGAYLIKNIIGYPNSLISYQSIIKFFLIVAPIATIASTILYNLIKYYLGYLEPDSFTLDFFDWWIGDLLGFIIFAPFTMIFLCQPKSIWRPRYLTVGLPVIFIFLAVIFIYNKTHFSNIERVNNNLNIKNEILISKINQNIAWTREIINRSKEKFLSIGDPTIRLDNYFHNISLEENNKVLKAIIWIENNNTHYVKISKKYNPKKFITLETYDYTKFIDASTLNTRILSPTKYIKELGEFINIFHLRKNGYTADIILIHNVSDLIQELIKTYDLENITILLNIDNSDKTITIKKAGNSYPIKKVTIKTPLNFADEIWTLSLIPTTAYYKRNISQLNYIIAKLGFLFAGLIGGMLLIITGKTTLTDIQVRERTLDLDSQAKDLRNRKKQYQALIEQHPVILWRQDIENNTMEYISKKVEGRFGYALKKWLTDENFWINNIHPDDQNRVCSIIDKALEDEQPFELEYRFICSDSSIAWVRDVVNVIHNQNNQTQLVGLMIDVTETQEAKQRQNISESKYRTLFKHAADPLIIINLDENVIKDFNEKAISLFGSKNIRNQISLCYLSPNYQPDGSHSEKRLIKIYRKLEENKYFNFEWIMLNNQHKEIICNIELVKLPEQDNNIALANITDVTEKRLHEKKINQLAYYDNLTKLPNREYFYSKFEYFHNLAISKGMYGTIIYLDLDRFKILNDSLGHQAGDELLRMVAQRIKSVAKKNDFCSRLGGDEFVILTKKFESSIESTLESSLVKSELILEALNEPYQLGDYEHFITPSIGISLFPSGNTTTDQIIHQADIAMYASKEKGKNTITIYQPKMIKLVGERLRVEKAIRQAFDKGEFQLHYQPQLNINNEILSVEALLRWGKSKELNTNIEDLIDTIEQIGLTHELGYWVFDQACSQLENWNKQDHSIKSIAVNVSAKQFHQKLFTSQIISVIESYKIEPSQIIIELTEAVVIEDLFSLIAKLNELKEYGIRISLDDFGTGYSSLAYLKHLPIDQLKIDKMFIEEISIDEASRKIVKTIIDLAQSMNIELIAEGIETAAQFKILKQLGCRNFQGFYFSKPIPHNQLFKL